MTPEWRKLRECIEGSLTKWNLTVNGERYEMAMRQILAKMDEIEAEADYNTGPKHAERWQHIQEVENIRCYTCNTRMHLVCDCTNPTIPEESRVREIVREEIGKAFKLENPTYSAQTINKPTEDK